MFFVDDPTRRLRRDAAMQPCGSLDRPFIGTAAKHTGK
jgi:hypothetical protein